MTAPASLPPERDPLTLDELEALAQTDAWVTDDRSLLVRRYGRSVMTVTQKVDGRWGLEQALTRESWDFGRAS